MAFFVADTSGVAVTGTAEADVILIRKPAGPVNEGAGNDMIIADMAIGFVDMSPGNNSIATAHDLDDRAGWNWGLGVSGLLVAEADWRLSYTSVVGRGAGEHDYFAVTVRGGQRLVADNDFADGYLSGSAFDGELRLSDATGAELAANDDARPGLGGLGSSSPSDAFLTWENTTGSNRIVYLRVEQFDDAGIDNGAIYLLNLSVGWDTGQNSRAWNQGRREPLVINGEAGDDTIQGNAGNDSPNGGDGQDMVSFVDWNGNALRAITDPFAFGGAPPSPDAVPGVVVDMETPSNNTHLAAGKIMISIERVTGTIVQDVFFGDDSSNYFRGLSGDDWFVGSSARPRPTGRTATSAARGATP